MEPEPPAEAPRSPTQQLLAMAREVAAGQADPERLRPLAETLLGGLDATRDRFWTDALGNPEIDQDSIARILSAFGLYGQGMQELIPLLSDFEAAAFAAAVEKIEQAANVLRESDHARQKALAAGPTATVYGNRLLRHLQYLLSGGLQARHTLALLAEFPAFRNHVERVLAETTGHGHHTDLRADAETGLAELSATVNAVQSVLAASIETDSGAATLQPLRGDQIDTLTRAAVAAESGANVLAEALSTIAKKEMAMGPTPLLPVNMVLRSLQGGPPDASTTTTAIERCLHSLEKVRPTLSPQAEAVLEEVLATLRQLSQDVGSGENLMLSLQSGRLVEATGRLCAAWGGHPAPAFDEDEELFDFVHSDVGVMGAPASASRLPHQLQATLDTAHAFLQGGATRSELEDRIDHVERMSHQMRAGALRAGVLDHPEMRAAVQALDEGLEALRAVAAAGSTAGLDTARSSLQRSSDLMSAVAESNREHEVD